MSNRVFVTDNCEICGGNHHGPAHSLGSPVTEKEEE